MQNGKTAIHIPPAITGGLERMEILNLWKSEVTYGK